MNLFVKPRQTHRLREQTYGYWGGKMALRVGWGAWD